MMGAGVGVQVSGGRCEDIALGGRWEGFGGW